MIIKMSIEDLFKAIKTIKIGERIDFCCRGEDGDDDGEGWGGILRIDANIFGEDYAYFISYYGGGMDGCIGFRNRDKEDEDYAKIKLKNELENWDFLIDGGVLVEAHEDRSIIVRNEKED